MLRSATLVCLLRHSKEGGEKPMSWKLLVSAGLLCIVASPAFAVGPTASAKVLGLDTNGNWVWSVTVTPDVGLFANSGPAGTPPNTVGGSVGIEIGATASNRNLVSAAANATNFPNNNPGTPIGAGFPLNTNTTNLGVQTLGNNLAANLGSTFLTTGSAAEAFRVHTQGPTSTALTTTLTLTGAYTSKGRLAQGGTNYDIVTGAINQLVKGGNANIDGTVGLGDLAILGANFEVTPGPGGKHWQNGDFTGDGHVNLGDLAVLGANYGTTGTPDPNWTTPGTINIGLTPGAGASIASGGAVPEPTSIVLLCLGGLFAAACGIRRVR
jgi:hypothetical protein